MKNTKWAVIAVSVFVVIVFVAMIFPVFSQAKVAAKKTSELASSRGVQSKANIVEDATVSGPTYGYNSDVDGLSLAGEAPTGGRAYRDSGMSQTVPPLTEMSTASMAQQQRQVIRNGEISVRVKDVEKAESQITDMVIKGGGYVQSSSTDLPGENPTIDMTIRVVAEGFDSAMQQLAALGNKLTSHSNTEDVTAQLIDLEVRARTLTAKEDTFREMLRNSRTMSDIISLQERLTQVRTEIERMEAQRKSLSTLAALSTIEVHLTENATLPVVASDPNWFGETFASSATTFVGASRRLVTAVLWIVGVAPYWGIPVIAGVWLWKRHNGAAPTPPE